MKVDYSPEVGAAAKELSDLNNFLKREMQYFLQRLNDEDIDQPDNVEKVLFIVRLMAVFNVTHIDAMCTLMRKMVLAIPKSDLESIFSNKEILELSDLSQNPVIGKLETRYMKPKDSVKKSFSYFSRIYAPNFSLDVRGDGWKSYLLLLDIRHRITHPKSYLDQLVDIADYQYLRNSDDWFTLSMSTILSEVKLENPWLAK